MICNFQEDLNDVHSVNKNSSAGIQVLVAFASTILVPSCHSPLLESEKVKIHLGPPIPLYNRLRTPKESLKGAGRVRGRFSLLVVSNRGECQLPGTFYGMKKYCS